MKCSECKYLWRTSPRHPRGICTACGGGVGDLDEEFNCIFIDYHKWEHMKHINELQVKLLREELEALNT